MRCFCCGVGHHVTLQINAIATSCDPATFPDVILITTSAWATIWNHLGNAINKFWQWNKANLLNILSIAAMNISKDFQDGHIYFWELKAMEIFSSLIKCHFSSTCHYCSVSRGETKWETQGSRCQAMSEHICDCILLGGVGGELKKFWPTSRTSHMVSKLNFALDQVYSI